MEINATAELCHQNAVNKGFWDDYKEFGTSMALIHSEVSEALECDRKNNICTLTTDEIEQIMSFNDKNFEMTFKLMMKDRLQNEFADILIRVFDVSKQMGINLEPYIKAGMRYNSLRPYKHGKKY